MKTETALDTFTQAYIECAFWASTEYKFGVCPCCGETRLLNRLPEPEYTQEPMCDGSECGTLECQPEPMDSNYSQSDLAPETLDKIIADCAKFQSENDLTGYPLKNAGYDFWLTRNGHGCGFWENDFGTEPQCELLDKACKAFGECDLYVGDDGRIYI